MAKKNKVSIEESRSFEPVEDLKINQEVNPHRAKVLHFRGIGFDNNRIAALLGIQKSAVDGIK